jgi:3-methyladenine DNA glycosylase AlkD
VSDSYEPRSASLSFLTTLHRAGTTGVMPAARKRVTAAAPASPVSVEARVEAALAALETMSTARDRANFARFGITAPKAFGVSMANIKRLAKNMGRSHEVASALWKTGWYEARMLATLVDEPARVTAAQMDRWCRDFDNWGICDTACFVLFDRTPHAWAKVRQWTARREEFIKRAGFALLASLAGHDKAASDAAFLEGLRLIEASADDHRNFVKKGVSWALRRIGGRNAALHRASVDLARTLATSEMPAARWIGKDALRDITRPLITKRFKKG